MKALSVKKLQPQFQLVLLRLISKNLARSVGIFPGKFFCYSKMKEAFLSTATHIQGWGTVLKVLLSTQSYSSPDELRKVCLRQNVPIEYGSALSETIWGF